MVEEFWRAMGLGRIEVAPVCLRRTVAEAEGRHTIGRFTKSQWRHAKFGLHSEHVAIAFAILGRQVVDLETPQCVDALQQIEAGLKLTGHFLLERVLEPHGREMPQARVRLDALATHESGRESD